MDENDIEAGAADSGQDGRIDNAPCTIHVGMGRSVGQDLVAVSVEQWRAEVNGAAEATVEAGGDAVIAQKEDVQVERGGCGEKSIEGSVVLDGVGNDDAESRGSGH